MNGKDFTGLRGGMLVAEARTNRKTQNRNWIWKFRCDCGESTETRVADVKNGHTTSCGCHHRETMRELKTTHGMEGTRVYRVWAGMKSRCLNKLSPHYKNYGGRGITICNNWLEFCGFYEWAKMSGYKEDLTIERIDVNGNYNSLNCEWIPLSEQNKNKRNTRVFEVGGEFYTSKELAKASGVSKSVLENRRFRGQPILTRAEYDKICTAYEGLKKGDK